jgi:transcriptional regulator with XRE-family HTH domain
MDNVGRNIKFLRKRNGLTQDDLARKIGINRYKIGSYEEGRALPKLELLQIMANYFKLSLDALVNTRLWDSDDVTQSHNFNHEQTDLRVLTVVVNSDNEERFAIVPQKASAGYTKGYADPDYIEKLPVFDLPLPEFSNDRTYRVFQISGDSMEPIPSGSYIICEYLADPGEIRYGEPHILVTKNDGIVYKRIEKGPGNDQKLVLQSDNPGYKSYTINRTEVLELWKAVGFISTKLPDTRDMSRSKIQHLIEDLKNELGNFKDYDF